MKTDTLLVGCTAPIGCITCRYSEDSMKGLMCMYWGKLAYKKCSKWERAVGVD